MTTRPGHARRCAERSRGLRSLAALLLVALLACEATAQPATKPPDDAKPEKLTAPKTPNDIRDAHIQLVIEAGLRYLKGIQDRSGFVGTKGYVFNHTYPVGPTALAALAMLEAGLPMTDPHVRAAMKYALETPTDHTYEVSLQTMVLAKTPQDRLGRAERRAMELLLRRLVDCQAQDGMWTYWLLNPRHVPGSERGPWGPVVGRNWRDRFTSGDRSNTQFAVLALWEAAKRGVEVPRPTLSLAAQQFLRTQGPESGWGYVKDPGKYDHPEQSPTMNATGLASLYILRDLLGEVGEGLFDGTGSPGCGRPGRFDEAIERAHSRVIRDLGVTGGLMHLYGGEPFPRSGYYSYSVERVGVACGMKQLGDHDWYRQGAWYFLRNQNRDGSWSVGYTPGIETAFAILFLAKGRAPFLANKLRWRGDWNNHTRDLPNLVRYAEKTFEQRFRWQIVDVRGDVDEWLDAPVLYLSGHESPKLFVDDEKKKLREFVERGGVILADDCCKAKEFDGGFRKLLEDVFPEAPLEMLNSEHPVWTSHFKLKPSPARPLFGVTLPVDKLNDAGKAVAAGAPDRTVVFYAPWTIGCIWNQDLTTNHEPVFQIGINVFRYATGKRPLRRPLDGTSKPTSVPSEPEPEKTPIEEPTLK